MYIFQSLSDPKLAALLSDGAVGVMPSDTVYGLFARAADEAAVERLYTLKSRDHKPGTLIAASIDQLVELGIKARYLKAVEQFWPGPVSVETPHQITYLNMGTGRQGIRIPDFPELLELLRKVGPLQTTSANMPGEPVSNTIAEARAYFGDAVDFYVDGGDLSGRPPSTIIRMIDDAIEVIREGAVKIDENGRVSR
ncbi:MAG TPA: L-threonylcarbamoyladenylate synthase [Candidatus Saccharimonadales bacterium]|nr:L-threonylcarbamoyladenylate synthase [Candidatus Saccharimonadales bacterium]